MKRINSSLALLGVTVLLAGLFMQAMPMSKVYAAQITNRRITLQAGASDGGSKPAGVVNHFFEFTVPASATAIGSVKFEYCTLAATTCTMPTGVVTTSATLGTQTGATGFTLDNTTNGAPYITRTAATIGNGSDPTNVSYQLQTVTNPSNENETFYVRITTYSSIDTTGASVDAGTVTAATAEPIVITGTMPESLVFCTGATVTVNASSVPDCSTATAGAIAFDKLFSPTDTASTSSQMAASTNAGFGYVITVNGATMTSGSNTIAGMPYGTIVRGTAQFGMNLKANTTAVSTPAVGQEIAPIANGTAYKGQPRGDFDDVDNFKFLSGDIVAASDNGGAGGSDAQIFTASYIVNVPGNQPAGTYTTTLTYICTPTF